MEAESFVTLLLSATSLAVSTASSINQFQHHHKQSLELERELFMRAEEDGAKKSHKRRDLIARRQAVYVAVRDFIESFIARGMGIDDKITQNFMNSISEARAVYSADVFWKIMEIREKALEFAGIISGVDSNNVILYNNRRECLDWLLNKGKNLEIIFGNELYLISLTAWGSISSVRFWDRHPDVESFDFDTTYTGQVVRIWLALECTGVKWLDTLQLVCPGRPPDLIFGGNGTLDESVLNRHPDVEYFGIARDLGDDENDKKWHAEVWLSQI